MLEGRRDLAVLWDIRVAPDARATMLVLRCSNGSKRGQLHGCRLLKIETQNTNVQACRFYERQGCRLEAIHRAAYPELRGDPTALVQGSTALSRSIWTTGC